MTIRRMSDLTAAVEASKGLRGVDGDLLQDILDSYTGVGGVMFGNDVVLPITTDWVAVSVMTGSRALRGLAVDLATGKFTLGVGAGDAYAIDVSFGVETTVPGWIEIGLSKNGAAPFSKKRRSLTVGNVGAFDIADGLGFDDGDTLQIAVRGSGMAPLQVTLIDGTFRMVRV